jgi:hypothetical protein
MLNREIPSLRDRPAFLYLKKFEFVVDDVCVSHQISKRLQMIF